MMTLMAFNWRCWKAGRQCVWNTKFLGGSYGVLMRSSAAQCVCLLCKAICAIITVQMYMAVLRELHTARGLHQ
jgi:hypothetical protein